MTERISDVQLERLSSAVAGHLGLHFPKDRWADLQRGVCAAAQEWGCQQDLDRYVEELSLAAMTQKRWEGLANHLTIGETYFFREKRSLEVLQKNIVPELIRESADPGRAIRIWSAGCATGEEPYSIAIVLSKLMAGMTAGLKKWTFEILATDLNSKSLLKACNGTYGEWSFRGVPPWVRSTYFEEAEKDRWAISPAIKKMVSFAQLNLIDDSSSAASSYPNGVDVIFCRNVLMYLTPHGMRKVVQQFHRSLAKDGWLIVSPTETSQELFSDFASVTFGDVTFYRKSAVRSERTFVLPAFNESERSFHLPQWSVQDPAQIPAQSSPVELVPETPGDPAGLKSTASSEISYERALELYEQGRYGDMEQMIVALPQDGDGASAMLLLARSYANRGNLRAALVWCDKAIAADKMAARGYYLRATILQEQDSAEQGSAEQGSAEQGPAKDASTSEVLLALQRAVYAEPEFVLGHFSLGNLALNHGKPKESEKHFENVLLLLAQYGPEDILPESEGLSAGRLRQMIVSGRGGMSSVASGAGLARRSLRRAAKAHGEEARSR